MKSRKSAVKNESLIEKSDVSLSGVIKLKATKKLASECNLANRNRHFLKYLYLVPRVERDRPGNEVKISLDS